MEGSDVRVEEICKECGKPLAECNCKKDKVEEAAPVNSDLKTGKEDRLASLKMQLEKDGAQLADDEKEAIEEEIAKLESELQECDKSLKEDSYEDTFFSDIENALQNGGFDVTRFNDAGVLTKNLGWVISNEEGEVQLSCDGTWLDESAKSLKEGFKLGEKAEILDQTERRGQPVALVKLQKNGDEYIVAFGYTVENDEISWDYGYYYYDETSGKEAFEKVKAGGNLSESAFKEAYSEKLGGDPEDFVSDVNTIKAALEAIDTESFGSHLAQQMVYDWIKTCNYQIERGNRLASENEFYSESEKMKNKPIVEAAQTEVKDLQIVKEQGNIYMLEDKSEGTRYIVGENYNLSEGEIENAEIYENKEEADKDYLDRCDIIKDGEEFNTEDDSGESEENTVTEADESPNNSLEERIVNLKMMDNVARKVNDEELFYDYWLAFGVPDGASEEDYEDIAKEDYENIEKVFKKLMTMAKENGLYDATEEELEFARKYEPEIENV